MLGLPPPLSARTRGISLGLILASAGLATGALSACKPEIGDKCMLSTDCSTRGDRLCDTSQPEGYCTLFNCRGNGCPDKGACALFGGAIPGCGYSDRTGPGGARTARSFCVAGCTSNADCRDGYVCVDPRRPPWGAIILDDDQSTLTCLVKPFGWDEDAGTAEPLTNAPICGPVTPDVPVIDASAPPRRDAGPADASDGG